MTTEFEIGHKKCCSLVCLVCYKKASRSLSASEIQSIQEIVIDGYSSSDPDFPNGVCMSCSIVSSKKGNDPTTALAVAESYDPEIKTGLRSVNTCSCKFS